ncbi:MAG TPA: PH domain-containing protein [Actinophytocola sp.]|uniref:PH domain-containing protein n=1 Tax=Actinophytocola sp. TaxID=1872138 RepID=UPI002DBE125C|nr:PH domain-containing protein [Actinophytocola sp.]HEU5471368.1 PH domain-containing protein [Actinophytocola sp.]
MSEGASEPMGHGETGDGWRALDRRSPAVTAMLTAGIALGSAVPVFASVRGDDRPIWQALAVLAVGFLVVVGVAAVLERLRWKHTRYRITAERVELRFSWIVHRLRSVPRDRIRTVDLTANPLLRLFGVVKMQIGTGQQGGQHGHLVLNPLDRRQAELLRVELLSHAGSPVVPVAPPPVSPTGPTRQTGIHPVDQFRAAPAQSAPATTGTVPARREAQSGHGPPIRTIAGLNWSWIRYAPVSVTTPILGAAAFGGLLQISEWFGLQRTILGGAGDLLRELPVFPLVVLLVAVGIVVGVIGSLALFVESWWGYRLTWEHGVFRVRRGLLTSRSLTLDERRLRGVEVVEPIGARLLRAAKVDAVATGLRAMGRDERSDPKMLLPLAPRALAHRVAAEIVGEEQSPTESVRLHRHPPAARGRRLRWAVGSVLLPAAVLALLGLLFTDALLNVAWIVLVVLLPVAIALGLDAYRNLGHGITGEYLVTRYGAASRHTVALRRSGVIGWTITSSPFQRRAGLVTLAATTAAQQGAYLIRDIGTSDGLAFAEEAVPGLLTPFLERSSEGRDAHPPLPDTAT